MNYLLTLYYTTVIFVNYRLLGDTVLLVLCAKNIDILRFLINFLLQKLCFLTIIVF